VTSLRHILSVKIESLDPAHIQEKRFTKRRELQEVGSLEVILEAAYQRGHEV
jgi:hypothetical protein